MSITMTTSKRRRTSDGTAICASCGNIIEAGDAYVSETGADGGIMVERNVCLPCLAHADRCDALSWFVVIAASLAMLAWFCLVVR